MLDIYNCGELWWAIYRMPIGYMHTIYDWSLTYNIYTLVDAYIYINIFIIITTSNKIRCIFTIFHIKHYIHYEIEKKKYKCVFSLLSK